MKPILFSTPMVQAILEGRKTQTRRIIKPQPDPEGDAPGHVPRSLGNEDDWGKWYWDTEEGERILKFCPFGFVGDILWVRETFAEWDNGGYAYKADGFIERYEAWERDTPNKFHDVERVERWKPSLFMPKEACRLYLKIKLIRAERLQGISKEDAVNEGIGTWVEERMKSKPVHDQLYYTEPGDDSMYSSCPILSFESLWKYINGPASWEENPWVWVIEFERCENPIIE